MLQNLWAPCGVCFPASCKQCEGAEAREARGARRLFRRLGAVRVAGPRLGAPRPTLLGPGTKWLRGSPELLVEDKAEPGKPRERSAYPFLCAPLQTEEVGLILSSAAPGGCRIRGNLTMAACPRHWSALRASSLPPIFPPLFKPPIPPATSLAHAYMSPPSSRTCVSASSFFFASSSACNNHTAQSSPAQNSEYGGICR